MIILKSGIHFQVICIMMETQSMFAYDITGWLHIQ